MNDAPSLSAIAALLDQLGRPREAAELRRAVAQLDRLRRLEEEIENEFAADAALAVLMFRPPPASAHRQTSP